MWPGTQGDVGVNLGYLKSCQRMGQALVRWVDMMGRNLQRRQGAGQGRWGGGACFQLATLTYQHMGQTMVSWVETHAPTPRSTYVASPVARAGINFKSELFKPCSNILNRHAHNRFCGMPHLPAHLHNFQTQVSQHLKCVMSETALAATNSGERKFKVGGSGRGGDRGLGSAGGGALRA